MSVQEIVLGNCLHVMKQLRDNSVDAVVTDPPYGLSKEPDIAEVLRHWLAGDDYVHTGSGFMGKTWDSFVPGPSIWREVHRVLKPGGHALVFAGSRTVDLMGMSMRLAGFEIRDQAQWIYGSGFPKGLNLQRILVERWLSKDNAQFVVQRSPSIQVSSKKERAPIVAALVQILPEGDLAVAMEIGKGAVLFALTDTWRSVLVEAGIDLSTISLSNKNSVDLSKEVNKFITKTVSVTITDEKTWSLLIGQITSQSTILLRDKLIDGVKWPVVSVVTVLNDGLSSLKDIPIVTALGDAIWNPVAKWRGFDICLKPAHEPIIVARKPLDGTVAANVLKHGTGAINIDGCRIKGAPRTTHADGNRQGTAPQPMSWGEATEHAVAGASGRWPANVILSHSEDCVLVGEREVKANGSIGANTAAATTARATAMRNTYQPHNAERGEWKPYGNGDGTETVEKWECVDDCPVKILDEQSGGASRFFYCAKTSTSEREAGLEHMPKKSAGELTDRNDGTDGLKSPRAGAGRTSSGRANVHPTVKPIELMRYLIRLVTPTGGVVLDPFSGSGSTGCAAALEDANFIGIEMEPAYVDVARARITHWQKIASGSEKTVDRKNGNGVEVISTQAAGHNPNSIPNSNFADNPADSEELPNLFDEAGEEDDMSNLPSDLAEQVANARTAGGGNWIQHGDYVFMVKKWFYQKIQDRCIILEVVTVEGNKKVVVEGSEQKTYEPNAFGSECSSTANFDGDGKLSAPANARAPILGLFNFKEGEVPNATVQATLNEVVDDRQPATGMIVGCSTFAKEIRSKKGSFITGLNWECVSKPGEGINAPHLVQARIAAMKVSSEHAAILAAQHLAEFRKQMGIAAPTTTATTASIPSQTNTTAPSAFSAPAAPTTTAPTFAAPSIPTTTIAPPPAPPALTPVPKPWLDGWAPNPNAAGYFYRYVNGAAEQKTEAEIQAAFGARS